MVNNQGQQGSLERLGIELETQPPEDILSPGDAKGVRFQVSQPRGYYPVDVDTFVEQSVVPSLTWYAETLHERDLSIHKLGEKLDQAEVDLQNLRAELAVAQYSAPLGAALEKNEDDKEMVAILEQLEDMKVKLAAAQAEAAQFRQYSADQDEYITALLTQLENTSSESSVSDDVNTTSTEYAAPTMTEPEEEAAYVAEAPQVTQPDYGYVEDTTSEPTPEAAAPVEEYPSYAPQYTEPAAPAQPAADPYADFYSTSSDFMNDTRFASDPEPVLEVEESDEVDTYEEEPLELAVPLVMEEPSAPVTPAAPAPQPAAPDRNGSRMPFPTVPRRNAQIPDELPPGIRRDDLE